MQEDDQITFPNARALGLNESNADAGIVPRCSMYSGRVLAGLKPAALHYLSNHERCQLQVDDHLRHQSCAISSWSNQAAHQPLGSGGAVELHRTNQSAANTDLTKVVYGTGGPIPQDYDDKLLLSLRY